MSCKEWLCGGDAWICCEQDSDDGTAGKEEEETTKEDADGCGEVGHAGGWCDGE